MRGWRWQTIGVLGLVAVLTCACATNTRNSQVARLTEDLENDGLSVGFRTPMVREEVTTTLTDDEASARIVEWYRKTPRGSHNLGMRLQQEMESKLLAGTPIATTHFETPHLRVTTLMSLVVVETRSSENGEWKQVAWAIRREDKELCDWLTSQYGRELTLQHLASQKSETESSDASTSVVPVAGQESEE